MTGNATEPGSGVYAVDCARPKAGVAVTIAADGNATVVAGGKTYKNVLTSYSFFGKETPPDFQIAILFDEHHSPLPSEDGQAGRLEIWRGEAAFYALPNGKKDRRLTFCAELTDTADAGPSFDCAHANGTVETMICTNRELARRDRSLAAAFHRALGRVEGNAADAARLKAEQRGWIKGRNDCWKADEMLACVSAAYSDRHAMLIARYGLIQAGKT